MASYGKAMVVWSLAPQVRRLADWGLYDDQGIGGKVLSLDQLPDTGSIISMHEYGGLTVRGPFGTKVETVAQSFGALKAAPVIR
jgi:hypothetical protein